jgi:hypothetical protein
MADDEALRVENQRLRGEIVRLIREWWRGPGRLLEVLPDATDQEKEAARAR